MQVTKSVAILTAAFALAACASEPSYDQVLTQAKQDYDSAASNPDVVSLAPVQLREAQDNLQLAENASDQKMADHYAFLTSRNAQIAVQTASLKKSRQIVANAPAQ